MWIRPSATLLAVVALCGSAACTASQSGTANSSSSGQGNGGTSANTDGDDLDGGGGSGTHSSGPAADASDDSTGGGSGSTGSSAANTGGTNTGGTSGGTSTGTVNDEAGRRLFDVKAKFARIDLTVSAEAEASLRKDPKTYTQGSFTFTDDNGTVGPLTVGLRGKGMGSFQNFDGKMSFKVDFNRVVANQTLFGLGKLNLNNLVQDPSAIHEWTSYELLRTLKVPAPRVGYARVFVNGVQFGFYAVLETADDKPFLKRNFSGTQVLYEGSYIDPDGNHSDLLADRIDMFELDKGTDDNRTLLKRLIGAIASEPEDKVYTNVSTTLLDWTEVLPMMAMETVIGHWDGYVSSANNYYVHFDNEQVARLIPWGVDQTLEKTHRIEGDMEGIVFKLCLRDAACDAAYRVAYARAQSTATTFLSQRSAELRALAARLAIEMKTDPRTPNSDADIPALTEGVISFLKCQGDPNADRDHDGAMCTRDCNENDPTINSYAGEREKCGDGIDQDCDGKDC